MKTTPTKTRNVRDMKPGMWLKTRDCPYLFEIVANDVYSEDGTDAYGLTVRHPAFPWETESYDTTREVRECIPLGLVEYATRPVAAGCVVLAGDDGFPLVVDRNNETLAFYLPNPK